MINPENLVDATSALIVGGGTLLATLLRCGFTDSGAACVALRRLLRKRFDAANFKAELAVHVQDLRQDGVIRTEPHLSGDAEFDEATGALIGSRSVASLHTAHFAHKRRRAARSMRAVRTLNQAADLSPVLGLAGTLISLSQLPASGGQDGSFTSAIAMAVLTTLYGLLLGNMVFAPLARAVARRASDEEQARQEVLDWLESQVGVALPRHGEEGHAPVNGQGRRK